MNLKELTWENHKKAERREFASILMSGKIEPELYYRYLTNQFYMYNILEAGLRTCGLPTSYWGVFRASRIRLDMQELEEQHGFVFDPAFSCFWTPAGCQVLAFRPGWSLGTASRAR